MAFSCHCVSNCRQHVGFKNKWLNFALFLSPFVLQGTWYRTNQSQCKSQGRGCKTQADGCCLWMASLCDSNCITLNYGWNDPFLGWGYKSGSLKLPSPSLPFSLLPSLSASEFFFFFFFLRYTQKLLSPVLAALSKTNTDSDESANYDGWLLPPACMEVGVYTYLQNVFDSGWCPLKFKA